ncbi:coiled-coil domain-containing protein 8-like [Oreochromis niloticus]|uniref:coiled-coil domain-containing protein 8-like n=1 Tax=Oreochromis niloticus TaxID=8128 RepID=UPI000904A681|nr:coiled-coil domain-containing protein 8-like [Oreochromis niloticus]
MSSFSVVEFVDEVDSDGCKKVDIVPSEWFHDAERKLCWWPPASLVNVTKAVKEGTPPTSNWILCNVRVMGNAATYANARAKLHQAEYSSDLTDNENGIRKRKPSVKLMKNQLSSHTESSEPSDSDEELPPTPPEQLLKRPSRKNNSCRQPRCPECRQPRCPECRQPRCPECRQPRCPECRQPRCPECRQPRCPECRQPRCPECRQPRCPECRQPRCRSAASPAARSAASPAARSAASPAARSAASPACEPMFSKVLAILEEVKETQLVHSKMLNALLKQKNCSVTEVPEGVVLPLKTQDDVEALNGKLEDSSLMSAVVAMVADIGGTSVDDATRRMMKFLISPKLAVEYNLLSRHGKKKFRDLRLFNVVYEALKKNSLTAKVNLQEAEKALSKWFTGARDRGGLRAARGQNRLMAL